MVSHKKRPGTCSQNISDKFIPFPVLVLTPTIAIAAALGGPWACHISINLGITNWTRLYKSALNWNDLSFFFLPSHEQKNVSPSCSSDWRELFFLSLTLICRFIVMQKRVMKYMTRMGQKTGMLKKSKNVHVNAMTVAFVAEYQNLNSGSRRMNARNSSLCRVGRARPSSREKKEKENKNYAFFGQQDFRGKTKWCCGV